MTYIYT